MPMPRSSSQCEARPSAARSPFSAATRRRSSLSVRSSPPRTTLQTVWKWLSIATYASSFTPENAAARFSASTSCVFILPFANRKRLSFVRDMRWYRAVPLFDFLILAGLAICSPFCQRFPRRQMHHTTFRRKKNELNMNSFRPSATGGWPATRAKSWPKAGTGPEKR